MTTTKGATPGALEGITIVEIAERPAGEYTGKLLADFGAEVIKVERPGGAPTRAMGPFRADDPGGESALFAYLNTNKKSVVLDLENPADRATLDGLLARANGLIDDHDRSGAPATTSPPSRSPSPSRISSIASSRLSARALRRNGRRRGRSM